MNIRFQTNFILAIATASSLAAPIFSQASWAQSIVQENSKEDGVSFYCDEIVDNETGEQIPATLAYVPQRQESIPIIAWKSNYIAKWNAKARCEAVSPKFQTFYKNGRLTYLTHGENNGYPIICATREWGEVCQAEDQLFQLKFGSNPKEILIGLNELLAGKTSTPIYQNSHEKVYVSIEDLLKNLPSLEEQ